MPKIKERFDATGVVRDFRQPSNGLGTAMFSLQVGNMTIPCHLKRPPASAPADGEPVRVVGSWILDDDLRLCVEAHALFPQRPAHGWQRTGT